MKQKVFHVVKLIAFLTVGLVIFFYIQDVMTPDDGFNSTPEKVFNAYYSLEDNTVDALLFGGSLMEFGVSNMRLYEDTGIVSFNLCTGNQPIGATYYFLKSALKTQKPKVVLLDGGALFRPKEDNVPWRLVADHLPYLDVKLELAKDYGKQSFGDGFLSVFFPIIKYHSRWNELSAKDFDAHWKGFYYTGGHLIMSQIVPAGTTRKDIEATLALMRQHNDDGQLTEIIAGEKNAVKIDESLSVPMISESNWSYLLKIRNLCEENGAELILVSVPECLFPQTGSGWNSERVSIVKEYAEKEKIEFLDLASDLELIDWKTESFDGGMHLNCRGAEKVTKMLGEYLQEKITPSGTNELYESAMEKYDKVFDVAMLESETDLHAYVERLSQRLDDSTVFIAVSNEYTTGMTEDDYAVLQEKLGLQMVQDGTFSDSYLAVIDNGELLYEARSNRRINHSMTIDDLSVSLLSSGWLSNPAASIKLGGKEYIQGDRGIKFVVYDHETDLVIDSVSFDTFQASKPASRSNIDALLRAYESKVALDKD